MLLHDGKSADDEFHPFFIRSRQLLRKAVAAWYKNQRDIMIRNPAHSVYTEIAARADQMTKTVILVLYP